MFPTRACASRGCCRATTLQRDSRDGLRPRPCARYTAALHVCLEWSASPNSRGEEAQILKSTRYCGLSLVTLVSVKQKYSILWPHVLGHRLWRLCLSAHVYLRCTYSVPRVYPDFGECVSGEDLRRHGVTAYDAEYVALQNKGHV